MLTTKKLSILIIICTYCLYLAAEGTRPLGQRINNIYNHTYSEPSGTTTTSLQQYYYADNNTALIDSIIGSGHNSTFTNSITTLDNNWKFIEYNEYIDQGQNIEHSYAFTLDAGNKIQYFEMSGSIIYQMYYYYNDFNKPDSVIVLATLLSSGDEYGTKYILSYDVQHRLIQGLTYLKSYGVWRLDNRYIQTYADNTQPLDNPLQIINYCLYAVQYNSYYGSIDYFIPVLDVLYPAQSITRQWYYNGNWDNQEAIYETSVQNGEFQLYKGTSDIATGDYCNTYWYFSNSGLYKGRHYDRVQIYYSNATTIIDYEDYTENTDEYHNPTLSQIIKSYPNPFKDCLNIKLSDDKAPTDISIFNIKGQLIRNWKDIRAGELTWDGKDNSNHPVSCGVYIIKAKQGKSISTTKVIKY